MQFRKLRNAGLAIGAAGTAYIYDRFYCYSVAERSVRAISTGVYITYQYKFVWTPETAPEINTKVARRLVDTCKANEGLYVKFGQALASMAFALPREYHEPLSELHDQAKTFSLEEVKKIVDSEIGALISDGQLTDFEELPIASASLAQVHRAKFNGKPVAVKVQKPNVAVQSDWDLRLYHLLLTVYEYTFDLPLEWTYEYTRSQLLGEVDFRSEAEHSNRAAVEFQQCVELRDRVYVPAIYAATKRVIISEWIDNAIKITDKKQMLEIGLDPTAAVNDAVSAFAYQIFHVGHVHCDPHPGNLLVRRHPSVEAAAAAALLAKGATVPHQVVVIDHGLYVELSHELRLDYAKFWVAMTPPQDKAALAAICAKWGIADFELYANVTAFKQQVGRGASMGGPSNDRSAEDLIMQETSKGFQHSKAELQALMKQRIRTALKDTELFPRPLLFVGRCQNYIRATNWAHGNPIDRFAVMMQYANSAVALDSDGSGTGGSRTVWDWVRGVYVSSVVGVVQVFTRWFPDAEVDVDVGTGGVGTGGQNK